MHQNHELHDFLISCNRKELPISILVLQWQTTTFRLQDEIPACAITSEI